MINKNISVHLQDYPDVSFINDEKELVENMDLVRSICSTTLSIRDNKNLRVRLPLASLTIIGKNANKILDFKEIIADEVNVKEVFIKEDFNELAELKLQVNFKKIGAKYPNKVKEIIESSKQGNWQKSGSKIEISGVILENDEFEIKLLPKNIDEKKYAILALSTNDYLVQLDIEITNELEQEGIARDVIRAIQQNRKDADLDISDKISLVVFSNNSQILEVTKLFENYIKEQVLASELKIAENLDVINSCKNHFENKLEEGNLTIGISSLI